MKCNKAKHNKTRCGLCRGHFMETKQSPVGLPWWLRLCTSNAGGTGLIPGQGSSRVTWFARSCPLSTPAFISTYLLSSLASLILLSSLFSYWCAFSWKNPPQDPLCTTLPFSTHPSLRPSLCSQGKFLRLRLVQLICLWWATLGSGAYKISYKQETGSRDKSMPPPDPRSGPTLSVKALVGGLYPEEGVCHPPQDSSQQLGGPYGHWHQEERAESGENTSGENTCAWNLVGWPDLPNHFPPQHQSCWYCCCI